MEIIRLEKYQLPTIKSQIRDDLLISTYQHSDSEELSKWLVTPPQVTSLRVSKHLISPKDALSLTREIVSNYCRERKWDPYLSVDMHPYLHDCILVACSGPHQIELVGSGSKFVIVDIHAGQAICRGAHLYKAGIKAMSQSIHAGDLVSVLVDVNEVVLNGALKFDTGQFVHIANGLCHISREQRFSSSGDIRATMRGVGVEITEPVYRTIPEAILAEHLLFMQNIPSMLCAHALNPTPNDVIIDMCASPGGKTSHIASLVASYPIKVPVSDNHLPTGHIYSCDKSEKKCATIRDTLARLRIKEPCVTVVTMDSRYAKEKFPSQQFDKILLDPPCSGIGQRPIFKWPQTIDDNANPKYLQGMPEMQKKLFHAAVELLKPGGELVYSTCTINRAENEEIVEWALDSFSGSLELVDLRSELSCTGSPLKQNIGRFGVSDIEDISRKTIRFDHLSSENKENVADRWPLNDSIAFFIAKFRKLNGVE